LVRILNGEVVSQGEGLNRPMWRAIATFAAVLAASAALASPPAKDNRDPVPGALCAAMRSSDVPAERLERLARGFNLTGWLDQDTPRQPDLDVLKRLRAKGFTHIRLPVDGEALMPDFANAGAIDDRLNALDEAVSRLLALGYAVIVDMHPGSRFKALHVEDPDRGLQQLEAAWRLIAARFAGRDPGLVFFELLNEPSVRQSVWEGQAEALAAMVRGLAPNHTLIYGPAGSENVQALAAITPLAVANVVYAVHFYEPMAFTHQGLDWAGDSPLRYLQGVPFPLHQGDPAAEALIATLTLQGHAESVTRLQAAMAEGWDQARVQAALAPAAEWAARYRKPIIVDEFGVLGRYAGMADRSRWLRAVRIVAEHNCFGWTHWEFAQGFGFLNASGTDIEPDLAEALLGASGK
jgi:endoglucanase